jgi:hypothetical protein
MYQDESSVSQLAGLTVVGATFVGVLLFLGPGLPSWVPFLGGRTVADYTLDAPEPEWTVDTASQPAGTPAPEHAQPTSVPEPAAILPTRAPYCVPGQTPAFVLGFARLRAEVGPAMGEPLECEHGNPENGDSLQQTTTGLAVFEKATGRLRFTDGWRHWALVGDDLLAWEGDAEPARLREPLAGESSPAGTLVRVSGTDGMGVALRARAAVDAPSQGGFVEGATVMLIAREGDYARVRSGGRKGWVTARYLVPVE